MQKLFARLNKLNNSLSGLFAAIASFVNAKTPASVKNFLTNTKNKITERRTRSANSLQDKINELQKKLAATKSQSVELKKKVSKKAQLAAKEAKTMNAKKLQVLLGAFFLYLGRKVKFIFNMINPNYIIGGLVVGSIGLVASIEIYNSSKEIYSEETKDNVREVSSIPLSRAKYYRSERKQIHISNLRVSMYFETGPKSVNSMHMEFVFESSNRYIKKYIEKNEYQIRDHILSTMEPMTPRFILTEEGKGIIKDKIKDELNNHLKTKSIEGQILRVNIDSMIAG